MIRNLKALGLALVAIFAVGALSASAASAADVITTQEAKPTLLTGVGHDHVFKITNAGGGTISEFKCTTSKFAATVKNGDSTITADVLYEGTLNETPHTMVDCNSNAGEVKVTTTGCDYDLSGTTTGGVAPVWITCEAGKTITIKNTPTGVVVKVPAQTPTAGGATYTNEAGGKVKVTAAVTGITFTCETAFLCGLGGIPTHGNNTDYTGTVVMSGFEDKNAAGVITPASEGPAKTISSS